MADISVVIPVYRAGGNLSVLLDRLTPALEAISTNFEIILVEDGGGDTSWEIISQAAKDEKRVRGIRLSRNYGQHNALLCGIRASQHGIIITLDDDLQHPPEEIFKLLEKLEEGYDVVYGIACRDRHGLWRNLASRMTKLAFKSAFGSKTAPSISAFRAFRGHVRNAFVEYKNPSVNIDVLLSWASSSFAVASIEHQARQKGTSNYTFGKLLTHSLNMMTGFSTLPLQLSSMLGFALTLFGLGVLAFVLMRYFIQGSQVPGFPFLASIISIFSGAQLFALGIIGEYLARMHFRMMERPIYTIRSTTDNR
jgi:Glycosyltransferases involved in cell wall biogenesis